MTKTGGKSLGQYVKRIMEEQHLTMNDVERRSGGGITDAYVGNIINGKVKSPSAVKLKALADGLGVPVLDLFRIAAEIEEGPEGSRPRDPWPVLSLLRAVEKIVTSDDLTAIVQALLEMSAAELQAVQKFIKSRQKKPNGKKGR